MASWLGDIIVTGGLLPGGSAGLNALANKVSEFLKIDYVQTPKLE